MENTWTGTQGDAGQSSGAPLLEQAKTQARELGHQAQEKAGDLMTQAREQMRSQITTQKEACAATTQSLANALRQTGDSLRSSDEAAMSRYADQAAGFIEGVAGYLRDTSVEEIGSQAEIFARRQPAVFVGGAMALGFLAVRFLKSSATDGSSQGELHDGTYRNLGAGRYDTVGAGAAEGAVETAAGTLYSGDETGSNPRGRRLTGGTSSDSSFGDSSLSRDDEESFDLTGTSRDGR